MEEILKIYIKIGEIADIKGATKHMTIINFGGYAKSMYFQGDIMEGAADTQTHTKDGVVEMSARYVLKGKDDRGENCQMFIENIASTDCEYTKPSIVTDSHSLKWMETSKLLGKMDDEDGQFVIKIFRE